MSSCRASQYSFEYRIALLGSAKVGKTALLNKLIRRSFSDEYVPTLEDDYSYVMKHKKLSYVCVFFDTTGEEDFPAMRRLVISKANAFLIVYSLAEKHTLTRAKLFVKEIQELKLDSDALNIVLVGNKSDLRRDSHQVSSTEVYDYVKHLQNQPRMNVTNFEVSAKLQDVTHVFTALLDMYNVREIPKHKHSMISERLHVEPQPAEFTFTFDASDEDGAALEPVHVGRSPSLVSLKSVQFSNLDDDVGDWKADYPASDFVRLRHFSGHDFKCIRSGEFFKQFDRLCHSL